eukprot:6215084-Pyramimonas_sp.AAC.1
MHRDIAGQWQVLREEPFDVPSMPRPRCTQTGTASVRSALPPPNCRPTRLRSPRAAHGAPAAGART